MADRTKRNKICGNLNCMKPGDRRCSRCKKMFYCSKECQKSEWLEHKKDCQKAEDKREINMNNGMNVTFSFYCILFKFKILLKSNLFLFKYFLNIF